jgi:hypothetical protein
MGLGTLIRVTGHIMGRRMEIVYEVTEFKLNKMYGFKSLSGFMDLHTLFTFEIMRGSTRINQSTQISLAEPFKANSTTAKKRLEKNIVKILLY